MVESSPQGNDSAPIRIPCYEDGYDRHDAQWWIGWLDDAGELVNDAAACDIHLPDLVRRAKIDVPVLAEIDEAAA